MVDLKLKVSGTAQDSDGKDAIVDIEREHLDGVLVFAKCEDDESLVVSSMIAGGWSVRNFEVVLEQFLQMIGKERFTRAIELILQKMEEEEEEHE